MSESSLDEFKKIITDFTRDLTCSYPEMQNHFESLDYKIWYDYCSDLYPENFFHILYENNELFDDDQSKFLLPEVDFKKIMEDETLSDSSKKTIWKYIQLVLFCVCNKVKNKSDFGDANMLFEAIKEDDLHKKIEETMNEMKDFFTNMDVSNESDGSDVSDVHFNHMFENMMDDISNNMKDTFESTSGESPFSNMFDAEKMKSHLSGIMDGKIGNLAKEIAEEASKEFGMGSDNHDEESQKNFLKNLFKNPTKLMDIVKNIGSKLEEKFKSGEIKESELMEEAQDIMGKMKDMPGLKEMMGTMGMNPGGKFDFKGMANKMQQNMKQAKAKERMQEKLARNKEQASAQSITQANEFTNVDAETFLWNDSNSNPNEPLKKSKTSQAPKSQNPKKKKNKGKKKKN